VTSTDVQICKSRTIYRRNQRPADRRVRSRLEWRFRSRSDESKEQLPVRTAAERMKAAGILQDGDPVLQQLAVPFRLPTEADGASAVIAELLPRRRHCDPTHPGVDPIVMLNPQVTRQSAETGEQYEGCLSFFDVRGLVPRPLHLEVACNSPDGQQYILVTGTRAPSRAR
jgi:hypothetical protein